MQWIRFPHGSLSRVIQMSKSQCDGWPSVILQHLVRSGCSFQPSGVNGSTNCHICHRGFVGGKHPRLVGSPLSALSEEEGGGGGFLDCCVWWALSETGPRGPELKPYLRGFRTDGVPLFQDVFIIRKWGEWRKQHPPSPSHPLLLWINTPTFMSTISQGFHDWLTLLYFLIGLWAIALSQSASSEANKESPLK